MDLNGMIYPPSRGRFQVEEEKLEDLPWEVHFLAKTPRGWDTHL